MKKFILSDLHIGHKNAQYDVMDRAIEYIDHNYETGDELWGLGDWFHLYENGFERCIGHPMAAKIRELASRIPTRLLPGNHDFQLEKYRLDPAADNPVSPIQIVSPFFSNGIWYCHGHEYDPSVKYLPRPLLWAWNQISGTTTPGNARRDAVSSRFLAAVFLIQSRALIDLQEIARRTGEDVHGIVMGHTHLPVYLHQFSPELLFLVNDGDMRHSGTFLVEFEDSFRHITWDHTEHRWIQVTTPKPPQYAHS